MLKKLLPKLDLCRSWAQFGRGLGRSGSSFGHSSAHFRRFLDVPDHIFLKHGSKMSSKKPFGWILARFGTVLGRFWKGLGNNLEGFAAFDLQCRCCELIRCHHGQCSTHFLPGRRHRPLGLYNMFHNKDMDPWIHGSAAGAAARAAAGAAAGAAASAAAVCTGSMFYVIIGGRFAPPYMS